MLSAGRRAPEPHLTNVKQLTFGGDNAEAYFSRDGKRLIFQSTRNGRTCDQQFVMNVDGSNVKRVSNGAGKTTCGYFYDGDRKILLRLDAHGRHGLSAEAGSLQGLRLGTRPLRHLHRESRRLSAQAPDELRRLHRRGHAVAGRQAIVFTSLKDGDLDLYTMNVDGTNIKQLTTQKGYDGGPFFYDGKKIVYRAWHPTDTALTNYQDLLKQRLVRPNRMELWVMNADGSESASDHESRRRELRPVFYAERPADHLLVELQESAQPQLRAYLVNVDGTGLEQVTDDPEFDGFQCSAPTARSSCGHPAGP